MPDFSSLAIEVPEVLLPAPGVDLSKWAVVACDQYTSQADYWARVEKTVGESPSAFRLVLPEAYLGTGKPEGRIATIHRHMREYLSSDVFAPPARRFVYVERRTARAPRRCGLVVALDLERYDYHEGARSLVRASERTVEERLPARMRVRKGAALELPHAIVLIDDPQGSVIEPLTQRVRSRVPLYDAELMLGGGHVSGWSVAEEGELEAVRSALAELAQPETYQRKYGVADSDVLLFAAGDGNHSLAAAKLLWQELKAELGEAAATHPARHALVELVNVHDPGLVFEPIHRVVFGVDSDALLAALLDWFDSQGSHCALERAADEPAMQARLAELSREPRALHAFGYVAGQRFGVVVLGEPKLSLPVESLQGFLDAYTAGQSDASVDYIHGEEAVRTLCTEADRIGFLLPTLEKGELFGTIIREGALPAKAFSLGEADEKRFYMEARRISPD
jgi:hypothetical protein